MSFNLGALISPSLFNCVISLITKTQIPIVVLDPVVVTAQLPPNSLTLLRDQLLPMVTLITPTLNEATILLNRDIGSLDDMRCAARDLHRLGSKYVLIRCGHSPLCTPLEGQADSVEDNVVVDVLFDGLDFTLFKSSRLPIETACSPRCTLSAAITAFLAHGIDMKQAIEKAISYSQTVVQNLLTVSHSNNASASYNTPPVNQLSDEPINRIEKRESLVVNKQQQSQSESGGSVVIVNNHCWIQEPCLLPQRRSFVQLLKNSCAQEWVCFFQQVRNECTIYFVSSSTTLIINSCKTWRTVPCHMQASNTT
jgi:hydroxymethylpyrimidine kinase/phosphomethylpyrimidine kinase